MSTIGFLSVITNATMLAFVGSQLGNEDEKGGAEAGRAGIDVRIYSQRLWTIAVIIEHAVLVGRIGTKFNAANPHAVRAVSLHTPVHSVW